MFRALRKDPAREAAHALFDAIVAQARQADFYARWGVADTPEGRFEMLALHMFLTLDRLGADALASDRLARRLSEMFFDHLDAGLRELGVGDLSVGRKIRQLAEGFYGRAGAYRAGLAPDADLNALESAVARNVYGAETAPPDLAAYMRDASDELRRQTSAALAAGEIRFPALEC